MKFYVYKLIDPRTDAIFYIGKGQRKRSFFHVKSVKRGRNPNNNNKLFNKINAILKAGCDVVYEYEYYDTEQEAFNREIELIDTIGLVNLCNLTRGGIGGDTSNGKVVERGFKKNQIPWNKGIPASKQFKDDMSRIKKEYFKNNPSKRVNIGTYKAGDNHVCYGVKQSDELKLKRVQSMYDNGIYDKLSDSMKCNTLAKTASVHNVDVDGNILHTFASIKEAALHFNIPRYKIDNVLSMQKKLGTLVQDKSTGLYFKHA